MSKVEFKNRIKEFRKKKGLRQTDLARLVGIFQSELSEIERGIRKPSVYLAKKIAKALGASLDDLFSKLFLLQLWLIQKLKTKYWIRF